MTTSSISVVLTVIAAYCTYLILSLYRNIQEAKALRLPYVIVPFYGYNLLFALFFVRGLKYLNYILGPVTNPISWRVLQSGLWNWRYRYEPFRLLDSDTFLTVSPLGLILFTADPNVINQITTRRQDFPKPTFLYRSVNIYGPNILSSEGREWRRFRKLTSPAFSEKSNRLVFLETVKQTEALLQLWAGRGTALHSVQQDAMRLSLSVISKAGFGQDIALSKDEESPPKNLPSGHVMTFSSSLKQLVDNTLGVMVIPKWMISLSTYTKTHRAFHEWRAYMIELAASKRASQGGSNESYMDILGQLAKASEPILEEDGRTGDPLTDEEVLSNSFIFLLAGHETTSGTIQHAMMLLAQHPEAQKKVHKELERIFGSRSVNEWDYDEDIPSLLNGYIGAVVNETLRVISPVAAVPKRVGTTSQRIAINGRETVLPANLMIKLCASSVHRNPKYWKHSPPTDPETPYWPPGNLDNDLEEFKPERWIKDGSTAAPDAGISDDNDSTYLQHPPRGAYLPFSDGARSCLGKKFALVEAVAALAVIYSRHSVELAVDEWATDAEISKMSSDEKKAIWIKAEREARTKWQTCMNVRITLKMTGTHVPLKMVAKGEEQFFNL